MKSSRSYIVIYAIALIVVLELPVLAQSVPEPSGWYSGDIHVHRSCGGSPESVPSMFSRMSPENLAVVSQLADSGNGEVQNPTTDLPLVNGHDDAISQIDHILHWDTEWHWDATYTQYAHQALGGHIVNLGLSSAQQLWNESTFPILDWAHQHNGIAGFAHLEYLDGNGLPSTLTCCTPIEYPVEVALGAADFISEDVLDVKATNLQGAGGPLLSEPTIQAYYKLLNSGFRPGLAAGTDYPCNGADDGGALGALLTYVQVPGGQLTYRNWIQGIASGRTVVSRDGHNEFLNLTVNGNAQPGDEIDLSGSGSVNVSVQWTATENLSGTIEIVQNGNVIASQATSASAGSPGSLTTTANFTKSGWIAARRMGTNPNSGKYEHYVHTAAVFVIVNNAPIRTSATDAQYFVNWTNGLLQNTNPGGIWNSFFPTSLAQAQSRYQAAKALYQQIASEAGGTGPTLSSITLTPGNQSIGEGGQASFTATGTYSNNSTLNLTGQVRWASSNGTVAAISTRGLASALNPGGTTISATLNGVSGSTTLTVTATLLAISTQSLPGGTIGVPYAATLGATGGTTPYTWSVTNGLLPSGLSLNSATGAITGTPTAVGTFNFTVQAVDAGTPQQSASQPLTIAITSPGSCPCTIWPTTTTPGIRDSGPDSAVELGVRFRTDVSGYITGIRFYKGVGNTGTHVGNLWSSNGTLLATVTFSGETSSGWQQANFSNAVAVTANTAYVASYHTSVGHYSDDQGFFVSGVDNPPLHALADGVSGSDGVFAYGSGSSFPNQGFNSSNYWVDVVFTSGSTTTPPGIQSVTPVNGQTGASLGTPVSVTFNGAMTASSITATSFFLRDSSGNVIPSSVVYVSATSSATLTPTTELTASTTYTATIKGGTGGVTDFNGNPLPSDYTWSFTTGTAPQNSGPGGPILVIANTLNPFSRYYSEILSAEGLNEYTVADISNISASALSNYDVVILGEMTLSSGQVTMLTNWVNGGGHLVAMRPDPQLASLLGLSPASSTLSNAYLQVQTSSGPGAGIVGQTIQYHGPADLYSLSGASSIATLYSNASTSAGFPAVTIANAGAGQAAAFSYDLARSIIYTRQGNPAWSGQDRDGQIPPIRSDNLYFGAASFDPEPDWVDLTKVQIPQADEQQRLLANLILQMDSAQKPLPRFWYLPSGFKAAVVLTGDDHGSFYSGSATSQRFSDDLAASTPGCSVADWTCVRATAYLFPQAIASNPLTNTQVATYTSQGFEVAMHADSNPTCSDWSTAGLDSFYTNLLASFSAQFPSLPAPRTHRMHCISWSDYDSQPQVELKHGIRLDTTYYYWPPTWVNDQPGMFTGSGIPMRFTDRNGNLIDVYQATTQMTDESGQTYPFSINTLLTNALNANGFYGAFVVNAHNDQGSYPGIAPDVVSSAQSRGVPIISALQLLTWLDGRNSSSFGSISWSGSTLSFNITQATGARNLQAMLPINGPSGTLSSITFGGTPITFTTQTVKGVSYAMFAAATGSYQAVYGGSPAVVLSSISVNPTSVVGGTGATGTVTLSGPAPNGGAAVALSSSNTAAAQTPASVVITAGNTSATFSISTSAVSANTAVIITGSLGSNQSATLTVTPTVTTPPVSLTSVTVNPTSVSGGGSSTGTVTLTGPAPTGGVSVALQSSNTAAATVPTSVAVPSGSTSATFTITTFAVASNTSATITATLGSSVSVGVGGVDQSFAGACNAPASSCSTNFNSGVPVGETIVIVTWWAGTNLTATPSDNVGNVYRPIAGPIKDPTNTISKQAWYAVNSNSSARNITVTLNGASQNTAFDGILVDMYAVSGLDQLNPLDPATVTNNTGTGTSLNITSGTPAFSNEMIWAAFSMPEPGEPWTPGSGWTNQSGQEAVDLVEWKNITAPAAQTATGTASSSNPWVALSFGFVPAQGVVSKTATLTINAAPSTLSSISISPTSVVGGNSSTGTVTLTAAAPSGGAAVTLQSSNTAAATVPTSVTVPAGSSSTTFTVTTSGVATNTSATITATLGVSRTASLTVNAASLSSITRSPTAVVGGASSTGTITLTGAAPAGGAVVALQSSNTSVAQVPTSVTIAPGSTSTTFTITTTPVAANTSVTITATYGVVKTTTLGVNAATLSSMNRSPGAVVGGASSTGTVTLNGAAPAGGAVVTLQSSNTSAAQVPASITVLAGATSATFPITTSPVSTNTSVTITGVYGLTRTTSLTVNAPSLSSLSRSPTSVVGGNPSTGTVTLSGAAPAGGMVVSLQSTNTSVAQVPASVLIPAGSTNATFTISTSGVASSVTVSISGTLGTNTRSNSLTVTVASLTSLTLSPSTVTGGASSTGTLTLNGAAPPTGAAVSLKSSSISAAQVPSSVTIPAGSSSSTFTVTTSAVQGTSLTISGTYRSTTRSATLTIQ